MSTRSPRHQNQISRPVAQHQCQLSHLRQLTDRRELAAITHLHLVTRDQAITRSCEEMAVADQAHPVHLARQPVVCLAHRVLACRAQCDPVGRCVLGSAAPVQVVSVLHDLVVADQAVVSVLANQVVADLVHQVAQVAAQLVAEVDAVADPVRVARPVAVLVVHSVAPANNHVVRESQRRRGVKSSTTWKPRN